ncbi:MFS transporter [Terriglobus roseus]|uniref:Sugar phosphate permease n=1 Tax=Terriglobus roseus TaxID=392734 RepID=A0A1H4NWP5_9BACT|nr:MFS transporter [Terriglobus roseus]SEB99601.1 Sugar phosphate permease [Terriglobus roseus]
MAFEPSQSSGAATTDLSKYPDLKRRWLYIIPAVFVTYSLAYVDRANYGFGAAAGLAETLHITAAQSALLGSLFFFGYFIFQIPGAAYARKRSARKLIFLSLISWGILASLTGVIKSYWWLAADRLLLGAAESFILPGMLILLTKWFTRSERSRTNTMLILGNPVTVLWMSAVTGYIIKAFGWQMTFIIEGLPSVLWGVVWYFVIRDKPEDAAWISKESAQELTATLASEQGVIPKVASLTVALRNPNVILLCLQYFFWSIGVYGFVLWLPVMIRKGSSQGIGATGLLSAIPYAVAALLMIVVSFYSDRTAQRTRFVWPFLILAGAAFFGSYLTAGMNFFVAFGFLILAGGAMYAPYGPFFAIIPEMLPGNVAGEVTALINSMGALGSFLGSYLVGYLQASTGNSKAGYLLMSVALTVSGILILVLRPVQQVDAMAETSDLALAE